jgi:hypothetical protein
MKLLTTLALAAVLLAGCGQGSGQHAKPTQVDYQGPTGPVPTTSTSTWRSFAHTFRLAMQHEAVGYAAATDPSILSKGTYHAENPFKAAGDVFAKAPSPDENTYYNVLGNFDDEELQASEMPAALTPDQLQPYVEAIKRDHAKLMAVSSQLARRGY